MRHRVLGWALMLVTLTVILLRVAAALTPAGAVSWPPRDKAPEWSCVTPYPAPHPTDAPAALRDCAGGGGKRALR